MFIEFLTVTGWVFWAVVIAAALVIALFDNSEGGESPALFFSVVALVGVVLFTDAFVGVSLFKISLIAVAYFVAGTVWGFVKWYLFLVDKRDYTKAVFEKHNSSGAEHMKIEGTLEDYLKKNRPTAADNKARIVAWILLWPLSVLASLLTWPRRLVVWIFNQLRGVFDRMGEKIFGA